MIQPLEMEDFLDQGIQDIDVHIRWANPLASVATLERIQSLEEDDGKTLMMMMMKKKKNFES